MLHMSSQHSQESTRIALFCAANLVTERHYQCAVEPPSAVAGRSQRTAAAVVGIVPLACGNLVWDEGFRRGDSQLLAVMAYATPVCSALLLAVLGLQSLTWSLAAGAIVIVAAGLWSRTDSQARYFRPTRGKRAVAC